MKMLTAQQIFTKVAKHLLKQNNRAHDGKGCARWVDDKGNLCASACLIKPSIRKGMTNEDYWSYSPSRYKVSGVDMDEHFDLVIDLTNCHDENKPSRWPRKLRRIARDHKLKIPEFLKDA